MLFPDDWESHDGEPPRVCRFESIDWFLKYANEAQDRRDEQARLLLEHFPELIE
jgi:hypothetical protein